MKEITDIIAAYDKALSLGKKSALATVVNVVGSSYRRPGARMLVTDDGQLTGAISGGCLEGDALRKAVLAISQQKPKLVIYDTTDDSDARLGIQLGCNGIVSILFEPILEGDESNPLIELKKLVQNRKSAVLITGYSLNQQMHVGTKPIECIEESFCQNLISTQQKVFVEEKGMHIIIESNNNQQQFFLQYFAPTIQLIIAGAGNDALPVVEQANNLGWRVCLVDGRASHANKKRFATVEKMVVGKATEVGKQLFIDNRTAVILMTHNYQYDITLLQHLLQTPIAYIGMLGPAAKRNKMLDELEATGFQYGPEALAKVFGPTGLNLGAETADEIAISIIAEIMCVMNRTLPIHLKQKSEPIHFSHT